MSICECFVSVFQQVSLVFVHTWTNFWNVHREKLLTRAPNSFELCSCSGIFFNTCPILFVFDVALHESTVNSPCGHLFATIAKTNRAHLGAKTDKLEDSVCSVFEELQPICVLFRVIRTRWRIVTYVLRLCRVLFHVGVHVVRAYIQYVTELVSVNRSCARSDEYFF